MAAIKKIVRRLYQFNLSKTELLDGSEIMSNGRTNEFVNNFKLRDIDNGIIVTPAAYKRGFIYKSTNGGEIYNNPRWEPDIITFSYGIYGLKKDAFYRITVKGRNVSDYNPLFDITDDRTIEVTNEDGEILISHDFAHEYSNTEVQCIFRATSKEQNIFFRVGKIYINNIIFDEVELVEEDEYKKEETVDDEIVSEGKIDLVAYGIFDPKRENTASRYTELLSLNSKGLSLFFDSKECKYILERTKDNDFLKEPFTNINYIVDINTNKMVNKGNFDKLVITKISNDISPVNLKQGYMEFELELNGKAVEYTAELGRIIFLIRKLY